jgi:hypothetical protein
MASVMRRTPIAGFPQPRAEAVESRWRTAAFYAKRSPARRALSALVLWPSRRRSSRSFPAVTSGPPRCFRDAHRETDAVGHARHRNAPLDDRRDNSSTAAVDLYWLPLGAGGHFVRLNGRVFELVSARLGRRSACDLYHSALEVRVPEGSFVIEQAPVRDERGEQRGVVAEGAVGNRWAGRLRLFRYEIRRWRGGAIPDVGEAVESPRRLTEDQDRARRVLELVARVPTPVWGRDDLGTGDMWNSNSVISWLLARSGIDVESIQPPAGGRAPGWRAGIVVARRQELEATRVSGVRGEQPVLVRPSTAIGGFRLRPRSPARGAP